MAATYCVVEENDRASLEQKVNEMLAAGWVLQGGVSQAVNSKLSVTYCQAMVK